MLTVQDATLALSRLVLSQVDPVTTLASRTAVLRDEKVFNTNLKGLGPNGEYPGPRVNQYSSGRCWLFATSRLSFPQPVLGWAWALTAVANVLRYNVIEQLNLGDFQLSQNYLFFYDKLEKANYYLESVRFTPRGLLAHAAV